METKKVLGIIFSVLFIGAFAFVLSWGIINFNKVKDGMSGTGVYTYDDVQNAYEDGYSTALDNEKEYNALIESYKDAVTSQMDEISQLNSQITMLKSNNKDYLNQITSLENQKYNLLNQVDSLNVIKSNNETTILSLNSQINNLQNQILSLNSDIEYKDLTIENKTKLINSLNFQISDLQSTVSQLNDTNLLYNGIVADLNTQIDSLNTQITILTTQVSVNSSNVAVLNNKINELQSSIAYYEQFIANLESSTQVVVTFEFDGSVYNIQIVNKNDIVSVVDPTSTDYVVFNYWTVNGEEIDLSTYEFTSNTKVVANVTHKFTVNFIVDNVNYETQNVISGNKVIIPTSPTKSGYDFIGWSVDGVNVIDLSSYSINNNTNFYAVFELQYGFYQVDMATEFVGLNVEYITYQDFWNFNGIDYFSNGEVNYVLDKETNTWKFKQWFGFSYIDAFNIWNDGVNVYYSTYNDHYVLNLETDTWSSIEFVGLNNFRGCEVWSDGYNIYTADRNITEVYIFNRDTTTWSVVSFTGLTNIRGGYIWIDNDNVYYSKGTQHYVLDKETNTWYTKVWNGVNSSMGSILWSDGDNIYLSSNGKDNNYMLDKETETWVKVNLNNASSIFYGSTCTINNKVYYLYGNSTYQDCYVFVDGTK